MLRARLAEGGGGGSASRNEWGGEGMANANANGSRHGGDMSAPRGDSGIDYNENGRGGGDGSGGRRASWIGPPSNNGGGGGLYLEQQPQYRDHPLQTQDIRTLQHVQQQQQQEHQQHQQLPLIQHSAPPLSRLQSNPYALPGPPLSSASINPHPPSPDTIAYDPNYPSPSANTSSARFWSGVPSISSISGLDSPSSSSHLHPLDPNSNLSSLLPSSHKPPRLPPTLRGPPPTPAVERLFLTRCCSIPPLEVNLPTPYHVFCCTLMRGLEITGKGPTERTSWTAEERRALDAAQGELCCLGVVDCSGFDDEVSGTDGVPAGFMKVESTWARLSGLANTLEAARGLGNYVLEIGMLVDEPSRIVSSNVRCQEGVGLVVKIKAVESIKDEEEKRRRELEMTIEGAQGGHSGSRRGSRAEVVEEGYDPVFLRPTNGGGWNS